MLATLERPVVSRPVLPATPSERPCTQFGREVLRSVVSGAGLTFAVDAPDAAAVTRLVTPLRTWLLVMRQGTGGTSATVSPSFTGETYPAMLALVSSLSDAGLADAWRPDGARTVRLERAAHIFVSADLPVPERAPAPDSLLEVVEAHRIGADWYAARVGPRARSPGLTKVYYGLPGATGSAYEAARRDAISAEAGDGIRRHFGLLDDGPRPPSHVLAWLASQAAT